MLISDTYIQTFDMNRYKAPFPVSRRFESQVGWKTLLHAWKDVSPRSFGSWEFDITFILHINKRNLWNHFCRYFEFGASAHITEIDSPADSHQCNVFHCVTHIHSLYDRASNSRPVISWYAARNEKDRQNRVADWCDFESSFTLRVDFAFIRFDACWW